MVRRSLMALALATLGGSATAFVAPVSAYNFQNTLAPFWATNANVGTLGYRTGGSPTAAGTATYSNATVGAVNKSVINMPVSTLLRAPHGIGANGGGSYVNEYSILMDIKFNQTSEGWASLFNTTADNGNDGDSFVQWGVGLGTSGIYGGSMPNNQWTRLVITVDANNAGTTLKYYVNGTLVHTATPADGVDGRYSLYTFDDGDSDSDSVDILADNDGDNTPAQLSQLAFWGQVLTDADVSQFGAVGTVVPEPATMAILGVGLLALRRRRK